MKYKGTKTRPLHVSFNDGNLIGDKDKCDANNDEYKFQFENDFGSFYRIRAKTGGYLRFIDANKKIKVEDIDFNSVDVANFDSYLFRILVQPNGGV